MRKNAPKRPLWTWLSGAASRLLAVVLVVAISGLLLVQGSVRAQGTFSPSADVDVSDCNSDANADGDAIGHVCDQDPDTIDGVPSEVTVEADVEISGPSLALTPAPTSTPPTLPLAPNDDFADAAPVAALPFTDSVSTGGTTVEPGEPQPCALISKTVWYSFTPKTDLLLIADTEGSDYDTALAAYTGDTLATLVNIGCNDDSGGEPFSRLTIVASAGETYHFQAGGYLGSGGDLQFHATEGIMPPNDDFTDAIVIPDLPYTNTQYTCGSTAESNEPDCGCVSIEDTVWYKHTAAAQMPLDANTFGSDYDTELMVYSGPDAATFSDLTCVGCNDDIDFWQVQSRVTFTAEAGATYYFQVDGWSVCGDLWGDGDCGDCGDLVFTLSETSPTPTGVVDICPPVFPGTYNGLVRIDGQPAASGYQVAATTDGLEWGSAIVSGGRYAMDIPDHLPTEPPCFEGGTITFELDGMTCSPSAEWASGIHNVDLTCAPAVPPVTPTPTATPPVAPTVAPTATATPTVTPVKPPPTGVGGLPGSSSGLSLWAMALASWAGLTIVASLGALVAAKRR